MSIKTSEFEAEEALLPLGDEAPDFTGPNLNEFFDEDPCLLEIGPLALTKLIYGDPPLPHYKDRELTEEEEKYYEQEISAREEVASNFMKYFNIQNKHGRY